MVAEVFAGVTAFKTMFDIAKAMKDMDDAVKRNAAVADLGEQIIAAQTRYTAAVEQIRELEEQLAKFETWESEKQRYQLQKLPPGVFVYALKPAMANGEPPHQICEKCYQNGKKSLLHGFGNEGGIERFTCHGCGTDFYIGIAQQGSVQSDYDPFWNEDGDPRL